MIHQFQTFWENGPWGQEKQPCLLALSSGLDSMVLAHLLLSQDIAFGIAHCNFKLRGRASDEDALFVHDFALQQHIPSYNISFDTQEYASRMGLSIQEAARDLRYEWLEKIRQENQYAWILTAHHLNDSIETLLYNLTKGSGIRGLHGIPHQQGKIIRPLSTISRIAIADYAQKNGIRYREDASNASVKYHRNLIRHKVVPALKEINQGLEKTFGENLTRFRETEWLYQYAVDQLAQKLVQTQGNGLLIDLEGLCQLPVRNSLLYEWLHPYGFSASQLAQVFQGGATASGRLFYSQSHQLLVDRQRLILEAIGSEEAMVYSLPPGTRQINLPEGILYLELLEAPPTVFPKNSQIAYLDAAKLTFPLHLRSWRSGDQFQPLGMDGHHQKLQDYFSNAKLSRFDKQKIKILESAGQICWVVGFRLDERFKVSRSSTQVWKLHWIGNS